MRRLLAVMVLALAALLAGSFFGDGASANVAYESPYDFGQTFGTALRLLRVDLGCRVTEKDPDGGYLLFDYTSPESGKQVHRGAIELVRQKHGTHVSVQMSTLPRYHEQMVIDALAKKLIVEHGDPPPRPHDAPSRVPPDAGAEPDAE